jgi:hypothetical protein
VVHGVVQIGELFKALCGIMENAKGKRHIRRAEVRIEPRMERESCYRRAQSSFNAALVLDFRAFSNCCAIRWSLPLDLELFGKLVLTFCFLWLIVFAIGVR